MQSSRILDTYLYGESNRSVILVFKAFAICSMWSIVGEYFSFAILLIVDFEMPVMLDNCRTEMFLLYMMLFSNIFMQLVFAVFLYFILFFRISINYTGETKWPDQTILMAVEQLLYYSS